MLHTILTVLIYLKIETSHFFTSRPGRFTFGEEPQYPLNRRLAESRSCSGRYTYVDKKNFLHLPKINPRTVQTAGSTLHEVRCIIGHYVVSFADTIVVRQTSPAETLSMWTFVLHNRSHSPSRASAVLKLSALSVGTFQNRPEV